MLTIDRHDLQRLEKLLLPSTKGVHILFENEDVRNTLAEVQEHEELYTWENLRLIQDMLCRLMKKKDFLSKRDYLSSLPRPHYILLVRVYLDIVESTIKENHAYFH